MQRHCLSCSADLGANDVVEAMPIGRRLAFDAWKARLWVICPRCRRWNLTPIEERWEPVEALDRLFRDCRTRVQSENIGLARLADGTTLVRIGQALPGELAAWRYGEELLRRRWKALAGGISAVAVGGAIVALGPMGLAAVGLPVGLIQLGVQGLAWTRSTALRRRPVWRLQAGSSPTGAALLLRRRDLDGAILSHAADGTPSLWLPVALDQSRRSVLGRTFWEQPITARRLANTTPLVLEGTAAARVSGRALVASNGMGGNREQVRRALALVEQAGGADAFVRQISGLDVPLGGRRTRFSIQLGIGAGAPLWGERKLAETLPEPLRRYVRGQAPLLSREEALALEMALHEEKERRALEGELEQLAEEWREAEQLARIADALPDEVPE